MSSTQKPKMEGKTEANQTVAPATGQKEALPQWYDVDVVKGTQFTVTGYRVPMEEAGEKVSRSGFEVG